MSRHRVHDTAPPERWEDAFLSGNGERGIMVFGDPRAERVVFNQGTARAVFRSEADRHVSVVCRRSRVARRHLVLPVGEPVRASFELGGEASPPGDGAGRALVHSRSPHLK